MNKKRIIFFGAFCFTALIIVMSCDKKVGKPNAVNTTTSGSNTTTSGSTTTGGGPTGCDTVTFAKHIKPIIDSKCGSATGCHTGASPSGGLLLSSYNDVKAQGEGGRIKARVLDANPSIMPPAGPPDYSLSTLQKSLITCWLGNGYKQ